MKKREDAYIYGAGKYALSEFYRISMNYNVLGFIVSNKSDNPPYFMNLPVVLLNEVKNKNVLIIICSNFSEDIVNNLSISGFNNFILVENLVENRKINGQRIFLESDVINKCNSIIKSAIDLTEVKIEKIHNNTIVSLTSFPDRFKNLNLVIKSLKKQSYRPEKIILWISHNDVNFIPKDVLILQDDLFEICLCDDLKSYKKLIPALEKFPNKIIVTADDDLYYWPDWLHILLELYKKIPNRAIAHRVHRIDPNNVNRYEKWEHEYTGIESQTLSPLNFPTTGAGVLYAPGCFHDDVLNRDLFLRLCPTADDIWFYWMLRLNGNSAICTGVRNSLIPISTYESPNLWDYNLIKNGNNIQIENMIKMYGFNFK